MASSVSEATGALFLDPATGYITLASSDSIISWQHSDFGHKCVNGAVSVADMLLQHERASGTLVKVVGGLPP
jgi:hypothetical protein